MLTNNRNQPEETLREFLHRWCKEVGKAAGLSLKRQAELLDLAESTLGNSINPYMDRMDYKLSWLVRHMLILGSFAPLDYLEACVGRVAFPIPDCPAELADLNSELALTIKEFGDVVMETGKALEDGRLQRHEVVKVEREIDEVVRQLMAFRQVLKDSMERL